MSKRKTGTVMKIVAAVLIVASAVMFLLPWMSLRLSIEGMSGDVNDILTQVAREEGVSLDQAKQMVVNEAMDGLEDLNSNGGPQIDVNNIRSLLLNVMKGAWSPLDLTRLLGGIKKALPQFMNAYNYQMGVYSDANMTAMLSQANSSMGTAYTIFLILVILSLAMAVVAVVFALTDHRLGMLPYLVFSLIMVVFFIYIVGNANNKMGETIGAISGNYALSNAVNFRLTAWGFVSAVLAILAFVAMFLPFGATVAVGGGAAVRAGNWICPNCGVTRRADQKFCLTCGTKQPEPARISAPGGWKCPNCGTTLKDDQRFCLYCGGKKPETVQGGGTRIPVPGGWTCPGCGSKLADTQKFCPKCGSKKPEGAAVSVAPAGWTCPGCGSKLGAAQKFCPRCGSKKPEGAATPAAISGWTCPTCGGKHDAALKFCPRCGTPKPSGAEPIPKPAAVVPAEKRCPACGTVLADGMSFCPKCGTRYGTSVPAAPKTGTPSPFSAASDADLDTEEVTSSAPAPAPAAEEKRPVAAPAPAGGEGGFRAAGEDDL